MVIKTFKYAFILFIVSFTSASLLTFANNVTKPILEAKAKEKLDNAINNSLRTIYKNMAEDYIVHETDYFKTLNNLFEIKSDNNTLYVYNISSVGKNGNIDFLAVFNEENIIENIIYISHKETPGRGDKIEKEPFLNSIIGQDALNLDINTITGATYSSTAVIRGLDEASKHLVAFKEGL